MSKNKSVFRETRSGLYQSARVMGDIEAVAQGPEAVARRIARRIIGKAFGRMLRRLFR
ncbi:MAG: hypothetical protein N2Z84_05255 [Atribacterota bacterium]|nr:hypothetical protein [Atribacterota bacterium]